MTMDIHNNNQQQLKTADRQQVHLAKYFACILLLLILSLFVCCLSSFAIPSNRAKIFGGRRYGSICWFLCVVLVISLTPSLCLSFPTTGVHTYVGRPRTGSHAVTGRSRLIGQERSVLWSGEWLSELVFCSVYSHLFFLWFFFFSDYIFSRWV